MEYRFLGPVEVVHEGRQVSLGGRQRKTILSLLAIQPNSVVTADSLVDALWRDKQPAAARRSMQAHVAHLRKAVNVADDVLISVDSGYRLEIGDHQTDIGSFEAKIVEATELSEHDPVTAKEAFDHALAMWRGEPFGGAADDVEPLQGETLRLKELRLACVEGRYRAALEVDDPATLVPHLQRLTREHPIRERLASTYMLALYRAGRQAAALRAFDDLRRTLAAEVGIEPSPELDDLAQRIREHDSSLGRVTKPGPQAANAGRSSRWLWVAATVLVLAGVAAVFSLRDRNEVDSVAPARVAGDGIGNLVAIVTANEINGGGWSPDMEIEVSVDGSNWMNETVPPDGFWWIPLDARGIELEPGSEIRVRVDGETVHSMTAADLTFDRIDLAGHVIEGTTNAPDGTAVSVWVNEPGRILSYAAHVENGRWRIEPVDPVGSRFDVLVALNAFGGQSDFGYISDG